VGDELTAQFFGVSWNGTPSYQWKADGTDITGATAATYTLTAGEAGKIISVEVSCSGYSETPTGYKYVRVGWLPWGVEGNRLYAFDPYSPNTFNDIAYGEPIVGGTSTPTFVAVGSTGKIAYSPDGQDWTPMTGFLAGVNIYGIAYGGGKFVIGGGGGRTARSSDGIAWTGGGSAFGSFGDPNNEIRGVAYGEPIVSGTPTPTWVVGGKSGKMA
jgi:hypothetical protein